MAASFGRPLTGLGLTFARTGLGVYTVTKTGVFLTALVAHVTVIDGATPNVAITGRGTATLTFTMSDGADHAFALTLYLQ